MVNITDSKPIFTEPSIGSRPFGLVKVDRLAGRVAESGPGAGTPFPDIINESRLSGKQYGSVIIGEGPFDFVTPGANTHALMMATGDQEADTWVTLGLNTLDSVIAPNVKAHVIRPGSDSAPDLGQGIVEGIGANSWHQLLSALELPIVPVADLEDGLSVINNAHYSGKARFRVVIAKFSSGYLLAMATGSGPNDDWLDLGGNVIGAGTAGGPMVAEHQVGVKAGFAGVVAGDGKHTAYNAVCVSILSGVVTNAELADIGSDINASGLNSGGKAQGMIYGAADSLDPSLPIVNMGLWVAFGPQPSASWSNLDAVTGTIEPA